MGTTVAWSREGSSMGYASALNGDDLMTENLWNDAEAAGYSGPLGLRVYTSRLLGRDRSLVLHGGGNTSVKLRQPDLFGEEEEILYVKGSGWDLERIEEAGFAPLRLAPVRRLAELPALPDPRDGAERAAEIYGDAAIVVPYVMPGFALARAVYERLAPGGTGPAIGMVLLQHGIFSFGETARESYERMIHLVGLAEDYLRARGAWALDPAAAARTGEGRRPAAAPDALDRPVPGGEGPPAATVRIAAIAGLR